MKLIKTAQLMKASEQGMLFDKSQPPAGAPQPRKPMPPKGMSGKPSQQEPERTLFDEQPEWRDIKAPTEPHDDFESGKYNLILQALQDLGIDYDEAVHQMDHLLATNPRYKGMAKAVSQDGNVQYHEGDEVGSQQMPFLTGGHQ